MPDYDEAWGNRMKQIYGVTDEDLADPGTRTWLNRQQRNRQSAQPAPAPAQPAPAQPAPAQPAPAQPAPQTGGVDKPPQATQTLPTQPGQYGGINPGGLYSNKQPGPAQAGPTGEGTKPPPGATPTLPGQPGQYGGWNPGGRPPGPYGPPPGYGFPPSGYGMPTYGGPGTRQPAAGFPGAPSYMGGGRSIYQNSPMSYPPPGPFGYGQYNQYRYGPYGGSAFPGSGPNFANPQNAYTAMMGG